MPYWWLHLQSPPSASRRPEDVQDRSAADGTTLRCLLTAKLGLRGSRWPALHRALLTSLSRSMSWKRSTEVGSRVCRWCTAARRSPPRRVWNAVQIYKYIIIIILFYFYFLFYFILFILFYFLFINFINFFIYLIFF